MKKILSLIVVLTMLSGCAQIQSMMGNKKAANLNHTTLSDLVVEGKTTKTQIANVLGEPDQVQRTNSGETWTYLNDADNSFFTKHKDSIMKAARAANIDTSTADLAISAAEVTNDVSKDMTASKLKSVTFKFNKKNVVTSWSFK